MKLTSSRGSDYILDRVSLASAADARLIATATFSLRGLWALADLLTPSRKARLMLSSMEGVLSRPSRRIDTFARDTSATGAGS